MLLVHLVPKCGEAGFALPILNFEEPVMSVLESGLKSKTWLWSQQAVVEKKRSGTQVTWSDSHNVTKPLTGDAFQARE